MYYTIYIVHLLKARNAEYSLPVTCRWWRARMCVSVRVCVRERETGRHKYRCNLECSPQRNDKNSYMFVT